MNKLFNFIFLLICLCGCESLQKFKDFSNSGPAARDKQLQDERKREEEVTAAGTNIDVFSSWFTEPYNKEFENDKTYIYVDTFNGPKRYTFINDLLVGCKSDRDRENYYSGQEVKRAEKREINSAKNKQIFLNVLTVIGDSVSRSAPEKTLDEIANERANEKERKGRDCIKWCLEKGSEFYQCDRQCH